MKDYYLRAQKMHQPVSSPWEPAELGSQVFCGITSILLLRHSHMHFLISQNKRVKTPPPLSRKNSSVHVTQKSHEGFFLKSATVSSRPWLELESHWGSDKLCKINSVMTRNITANNCNEISVCVFKKLLQLVNICMLSFTVSLEKLQCLILVVLHTKMLWSRQFLLASGCQSIRDKLHWLCCVVVFAQALQWGFCVLWTPFLDTLFYYVQSLEDLLEQPLLCFVFYIKYLINNLYIRC